MENEKNASFFQDVYEVTKLIPYGRVSSYGAIANYLGSKRGARMVGWALSQAASMPEVPAHRVVNRVGLLSGRLHFQTPERMQELLEAEGISIKNHQVEAFDQHFWDPSQELSI